MKKRIISFLLCVGMLLAMLPVSAFAATTVASGTCGTNVSWTLDSDGLLTISGTGKMKDYGYGVAPWYSRWADIRSVKIGNSVTSIGERAFFGCTSLTSITIGSGVTSIGECAFSDCSSLTSITIPDSVTSIGDWAFEGCSSLTSITIPNSVTSIGDGAFYDCSSLTSITIPNSVTSIGSCAFDFCDNLTSFSVDAANAYYSSANGVLFNKSKTRLIRYPAGNSRTSYTIPNSVSYIDVGAFSECDSLTSITVDTANQYYSSVNGILFNKSKTCLYRYPARNSRTAYTIPESVTIINMYAFQNCDSLTSITIPNGVTSIGGLAFEYCSNLKNVTIGNSVTSIEMGAFKDCCSLTSITIPDSVTSIDNHMFLGCSKLTSITIPDSVTSIGSEAFEGCSSLKDVYYTGTVAQWNALKKKIKFGNDALLNATIHYNWNQPAERGQRADAVSYRIEPMDFAEPTINAHGTAAVFYRVLNQDGDYIPSLKVRYTLNGKSGSDITDENGIFAVCTPRITKTTSYTASFAVDDGKPIENSSASFTVKVKPFSYSKKWEIGYNVDASAKIGAGAEAAAGVKAEASAVKAEAKAGKKRKSTLEDSYDDGVRTLEVSISDTGSLAIKGKTGVDAQLPANLKLTVIGGGASAAVSMGREYGYKVVGYDENNIDDVRSLGQFYLLSLLLGSGSLFNTALGDFVSASTCNTGTVSGALALDANAGLLTLKYENTSADEIKHTAEAGLAGAGASSVHKISTSFDKTESTVKFSSSQETEVGYGIGKGIKVGKENSEIKSEVSLGSYIYGKERSNYNEVSMTYDAASMTEKAISYKTYEGDKKEVLWGSQTNNVFSNVTFTDQAMKNILSREIAFSNFSQNIDLLLHPDEVIDILSDSGEQASVTQSRTRETGFDVSIPIGFTLGVGAEFEFGLSGASEFSYNDQTGALFGGMTYKTSESDITESEISAKDESISAVLLPALACIWEDVEGKLTRAWNSVKEGVSNAYATVKDTVSDVCAAIIALPEKLNASYAVFSLASAELTLDSAAVSATVGEPYLVQFYADETQTELLSDEELASDPINLTIAYTDEMLSLAGASSDATVVMLHFDPEREVYIVEGSSAQNKSGKTVSAQITHNGEYILAVDSVAPCVSDFGASNQSPTPELSALVSDLSGIASFRFWIDNGGDLVNKADLAKYYNESTGLFTYPVAENLAVGEHTAHFLATDALGNAMPRSADFVFTVEPMQGTIDQIACSVNMITNYEPVTITATASEDSEFASMLLQYSVGDKNFSAAMEQNGDKWTAEITPFYGAESINFVAIASDGKGNQVKSSQLTVQTNLPRPYSATIEKISSVSNGEGKDYKIRITNKETSFMASVFVTAYDENGKILETCMEAVALKPNESETVIVSTHTQAAKVQAFVVGNASMMPLCAALPLEE